MRHPPTIQKPREFAGVTPGAAASPGSHVPGLTTLLEAVPQLRVLSSALVLLISPRGWGPCETEKVGEAF